MKKIILFILSTWFSLFFLLGATILDVNIISFESENILGATHERVQRTLTSGTSSVLQTYHYLSAEAGDVTFRAITGDDYTTTGYKPATTVTHALNSQSLYDDYVIIGGVNADFFESYGVPQEAYVEDGQVVSSGIGYANREVVGFKEDGSIVFGKPVFEGYEVIIRDPAGRERITLPLKNINAAYSTSSIDIYAYFDTYNTALPEGVNKYIATATETKGAVPKIFGRGIVNTVMSKSSLVVPDGSIVLLTNNVYVQNLMEVGDTMIVQRKMIGDFENVRWAVGAYGKLVANGEKLSTIIGIDPTARHPRTAIGIKADGSVFFVAMDGRQTGYSQGATLYEMADLMVAYGAITAYNFDGGGSTTMVLRNESDGFDVVNQPSDGTPRAVTNSVFLAVRVNFDNLNPYPIPDYSIRLDRPTNLAVEEGVLSFDAVANRSQYQIMINNEELLTTSNLIQLKNYISQPGEYAITVIAKGDGIFYKDSLISATYTYTYEGAVPLNSPDGFILSSTKVLTWDENAPNQSYLFTVNGKSYTIYLNRFNLTTLNLAPGTYDIEVIALGDGFITDDSEAAIFTYRVYSLQEQYIKDSLRIFLELLYLSKK